MTTASLTIDLGAVLANWRALHAKTNCDTAAVIKADAYGLGAAPVGRALAEAGVRQFFVAATEEGATLRHAIGPDPDIFVFSGHMSGDRDMIRDLDLIPLINSPDQWRRHLDALPGARFGVQLDSGMNRLGMEPAEWAALRGDVIAADPALIMSHLACADDPDHPMNTQQLACFREMTDGLSIPRSLAATGGILLGADYHFDLCRPGVGLYGGLPFAEAAQTVHLALPVIQIRDVAPGETVGYGNVWTAKRPSRIATVAAGYADGLHRAIGAGVSLWAERTACPVVGRVSMDMITVDVTDLDAEPRHLDILCPDQGVDQLAEAAGTIGYEILTSLGKRARRTYVSG